MPAHKEDDQWFKQVFRIDERETIIQSLDDDANRRDGRLIRTFRGGHSRHEKTLQQLNEEAGIFFVVNATDGLARKTENIVGVRAVFADLDGAPLDPAADCEIAPHLVIETSPGRYHVYWLVDGLGLNEFEPIQKAIAALFRGDESVHDLPRLARMPGYYHRKAEPFLTRILKTRQDLPVYSAEQIRQFFLHEAATEVDPVSLTHATTNFAEMFTRAGDAQTKDRIDIDRRLASMRYHGDGDSGIHRTQLQVMASLLSRGASLDEAVQKVMSATIAVPGTENWNWKTEEAKVTRMGTEWLAKLANDPVEHFNKTYAVLPIGGKTRVVKFGELEEFPGRTGIVMTQTLDDFKSLMDKYRHDFEEPNGQKKSVGKGSLWVKSERRRQFDGGMAFMPHHDTEVVGNRLNLWRGYGVSPIKPAGKSGASGSQKFLDFWLQVICNGDEASFDYLKKREALILQKRVRTEIALGLRSDEEGVGKGFYEQTMHRLLGNHAMQVNNPKHVIGNFNPHLEVLLRLTADEALFVGDPQHRNALFGLITEPKLTIEPKGVNVYSADNYLNISVTTNSAHFLPVGKDARRFFVLKVSPAHMQDFAYFKVIKNELEGGGYEALLFHLLHEVDLTDFNIRQVPRTGALLEQRKLSLQPLDAWWAQILDLGMLSGSDPDAPNVAASNTFQRAVEHQFGGGTRIIRQDGLYDQARRVEPRLRIHFNDNRLAAYLQDKGCEPARPFRRRGWKFPLLGECRARWEVLYPNWDWSDPTLTEWQVEAPVVEAPMVALPPYDGGVSNAS